MVSPRTGPAGGGWDNAAMVSPRTRFLLFMLRRDRQNRTGDGGRQGIRNWIGGFSSTLARMRGRNAGRVDCGLSSCGIDDGLEDFAGFLVADGDGLFHGLPAEWVELLRGRVPWNASDCGLRCRA